MTQQYKHRPLALVLGRWAVFSRPLMMFRPDKPKTRPSHVDRRRFSITTSSTKDKSAIGQFGSICPDLPPP
jgi:hypothetical protein